MFIFLILAFRFPEVEVEYARDVYGGPMNGKVYSMYVSDPGAGSQLRGLKCTYSTPHHSQVLHTHLQHTLPVKT